MDILANPEKSLATLQARGALLGVQVLRIQGGASRAVYVVAQGSWTRELNSMQAVELLLDRMEGKA